MFIKKFYFLFYKKIKLIYKKVKPTTNKLNSNCLFYEGLYIYTVTHTLLLLLLLCLWWYQVFFNLSLHTYCWLPTKQKKRSKSTTIIYVANFSKKATISIQPYGFGYYTFSSGFCKGKTNNFIFLHFPYI